MVARKPCLSFWDIGAWRPPPKLWITVAVAQSTVDAYIRSPSLFPSYQGDLVPSTSGAAGAR